MIDEQTTDPDSLSERLEDLATRRRDLFLTELRAGRAPRIEDFVSDQAEFARLPILRALIAAERDWHFEQGEPLDPSAFRSRFPEHHPLIEELLGGDDPTVTAPYQNRLVGEPVTMPGPVGLGEPTGDSQHRYAIIRPHEKGGLGVVSLARDQELHREVAIKEIRPESADDEEYRARFLREAEVTARLEHPGIVPVYGIGHHADGRPYYIMRFIRGETLKDAIVRLHDLKGKAKGALTEIVDGPEPPAITLQGLIGRLVDACHALAYAHHRKVLHRDVKPGNIMLGPFGETLVVDWGLAKTMDDADQDDHDRDEQRTLRTESDSQMTPTRIGSKIGTVGYMSPEQAAGSLNELRPASDIYSLGVTLYYLITGRTPFEGCRQEEFLSRTRIGQFPRPTEVKKSVPPALEAICLKAMALRPDDRYATAEALAEDLERWIAGQPVEAYPEPTLDRLARWSKKHRTGLAAVAVLLVSTTIGLAAFALQERSKRAKVARSEAVAREAAARAVKEKQFAEDAKTAAFEDRTAAREDLKLTRQSLRKLLEAFSGPELGYLPNSGETRFALAKGVLKLYQELIVKHPADTDVKYELALAYRITANIGRPIGYHQEAGEYYDQSISLLDGLLNETPGSDDDRIELAQSMVDRGGNLQMSGKIQQAEPEYLRALEVIKGRSGSGSAPEIDERYQRTEALALLNLAGVLYELDRSAEAEPLGQKSAQILKPLADKPGGSPIDRLFHILSVLEQGDIAFELGHRDEARTAYLEAGRLIGDLRQSGNYDNPDARFITAAILSHQGKVMSLENQHGDALKSYEAAYTLLINIVRSNFRPPHIERELAATKIGRSSARLAMLQPQADPNQMNTIQADLVTASEFLDALVQQWPEYYVYHALLGQGEMARAQLARVSSQSDEVNKHLELAIGHFQRSVQLNPYDRESQKLVAKAREERKRNGTGQSD